VITMGQRIRALRMRYGWSDQHGGFIRISGDGPFLIECQPPGMVPNSRRGQQPAERTEYWIWWQVPEGSEPIEFPPLKNVRQIKRPFSFLMNDAGELVEGGSRN
jgi:hypothetical protein